MPSVLQGRRPKWNGLLCFAGQAFLLATFSSSVVGGGIHRSHSSLKTSYDYIVAGGGLSGLVVANRLSENASNSVLIVEYGDFDDTWNTALPYYGHFVQSPNITFVAGSTPQKHLGNRTFNLNLGATVGGGSTVNGMAVVRGQREDYDDWERLDNPGWGWEALFEYFKKSSTLNQPTNEIKAKYQFTTSSVGYGSGPFQASFPTYQWPDVYTMINGWTRDVGIPIKDHGGANGEILGLTWRPISTDATNVTRSSARKAYYDPAAQRANLDILVGNYVSRVEFRHTKATGVQIISRGDKSARVSVRANIEVVLAAGAIHTPQILQLSGVGPAELLKSLNISVVKDLPGVGSNFQDHPTCRLGWNYTKGNPISLGILDNATFFNSAWEEYMANRTGPLTMAHGNTRVVLSLRDLTTATEREAIISELGSEKSPEQLNLPAHYLKHPHLIEGYRAQITLLGKTAASETGVIEFSFSGAPRLSFAIDKPFSRGTVMISNTNPHPAEAPPKIDFGALAHPFDVRISKLGFHMTRRYMNGPSLSSLGVVETSPGARVQTDDQIEDALRTSLLSPQNSHPSGTAAMMPLRYGGVVDSKLKVYGVKGLRVVDASILPLIPAANLQATLYAVAEKAADLIKEGK